MPIYQRPTENIGVTKTFSGTITDSGSTPIEGAVVALKRKGGGIVAFADTDASGNYSFNIDADGDFQLVYSLSKDPSTLTTSDELSPSNPFSYYDDGDSGTGYYACVGIADFPQTNGSPASFWIGTPKVEFVDAGPYLLNDAILTYGFTGPGTGAKVEIEMTSVGEYYKSYSSRVQLTELYAGVAKPPKRFNVTNFGKNYQNPATKISGTSVQYYSGSIEQLESSLGITTGFTYNNSTYYTRQWEYYQQVYGRQLELGEAQLYGVWGSDKSKWGVYQSDYSDGKFSVVLPGEQDKSNFDTTAVDNSVFLNGITNTGIMKKHGMQFYYTLIYGPGGTPESFKEPGLSWLASAAGGRKITQKELDIMKGYIGTHFYVSDLLTGIGINPLPSALQTYANIGNFFYQMRQAVETTIDNAGNGNIQWTATHPDAISNNSFVGYLQYYSLSFKDLMINVANEYRSFNRQKKGVDIPTSSYSSVIYPILQKAGISTIETVDGNTTRTWSLNSNNITYQ